MNTKPTFFARIGAWVRNPLQAFRDTSLGTKLILLFLVVTAAVAGPVFYLTITGTTNALTEQVGEGLVAVAETLGQNVGTVLAQRVETMHAFAQDPELLAALAAQNDTYTGDAAAIEAELLKLDDQWVAASDDDPLVSERLTSDLAHEMDNVTVIVPDFAEVFATDRYGGLVAASDRTSDYYQADEGWWQAAYDNGQGGVFIAEPEVDESAGVIGIDMAVPVYATGSDEIIGVLRTTLDATLLLAEFQVEIGKTGEVDIIFPSGNVMGVGGGTHATGEAHEHTVDPAMLSQLYTDPHGHIDAVYEETPSLISRGAVTAVGGEKFIVDLGWYIVVHQAKDEALAPVYQTRNATMATVGVIGLVAVVAAIFVGRAVANPILKLTEAVKRFAAGDRSVRTESKSADEIGTLTTSFNTMAEEVDTLMTDIETRSEELAERTRELEASQRVTFAASERVTPDELLDLVVNLIRDQFDLYHAQVYLVDEEENAAVLKQSTGYAGRQLLTRRHKIPLDATALVTKAIHSGEPVLVADTAKDPNFMANPLLPETRAELVVPLKLKEEIIGVMDAQDRTPGRFGPSTVNLFQSMADQVAILFENSELLERITEQTESLTIFSNQLRTAAEIARRMGTILDPERLLEQTVEMLQSRFGLYHAHIYVLDEANRKLVMRSGSGEVGRVLRKQGHTISLDAEKSLVARAARNEQSVLVNDTSLESDFMPNPLLPQTRSEVAIPLVSGDRVMGVLDIQDDQPSRFSQADIDTFGTLAGQIATALQTAGVFEQTQVRLRVSQALSGAQTEEEVLNVLIEQAGFYPRTQVMIFMDEWEGEERFSVLRRTESFDSRLVPGIQPGVRLPASQFQLVTEYTRTDGLFVSPNLPEDEHADPMAREMAKQMGTKSMAIVPIKVSDEQIGSISISSEQEGYLDEEKLHLYRTLVEQGATALRIARLNDEVLEREARFTGFAAASGYGFGMGELTGQLTFANPALLEMLDEESQESACKKTFFEYYTDEDRKRMEEEILPVVMEKGQWVGEIPLLSSKGKLTPTEQNIFLIYDDQGNPRMVANILTDITERKRTQEEMQKLATVVTHSSELVNLATLEGQMTFVNKAGSAMLGIDPDEIQQYAIPHVIPEELMPMVQEELLPTLMGEGAWEGELQYKNVKTGEITDVHASTFVVTDPESNEPLYLANVSMDITERKRFTNQLRTAADLAEQINAVLDPDQILNQVVNQLHDRFGLYHVHVYTLTEPTPEQLANADTDEVARIMRERPLTLRAGSGEVGEKLLEKGHAIPLHTEKSLVAHAARDRAPVLVNDTSQDPDFLPNPLLPETRSEVAVPLVAGENVLGVLDVQDNRPDRFTQSDIDVLSTMAGQIATALQNASYFEEVQRTAERLREVDRLKSEFLASMSHELRTPLNSIIGYTEIMLMGLDTELDPEMAEDVQAIYDNGQHLLRIINDVLDLAKIEAGRLELNEEEVPVEALVDAASSSVTGLLVNKEKPVEFKVEIEENLPTIHGDQVRLNQVINNLASNAVKFTDEGHITLRAFRDDGWVCLEVEDTGIGIAEEDLNKIFERFQQVDGSNARKQEGTGLGLAITRHLVEMHGGSIKVKSEPDGGSTFTVRLPSEHNGIEDAVPEIPQQAETPKKAIVQPSNIKKAKAPASTDAGASETGVTLSSSDVVDILLE